jgi:hypothetical protein
MTPTPHVDEAEKKKAFRRSAFIETVNVVAHKSEPSQKSVNSEESIEK